MSVAALSTAGFSQYIAASSNISASQKAMQTLQQSLASGNLSGAQTALKAYMQLNQSQTSATSTSTSTTSQLSADLATLGSAIGSGNLTSAQSAMATVQSDLKATPSQAITNAESAVAQTVQWVDDLLNLSSTSSAPTTPVDPTTSMLDSAYGLNPTSTTDPTTSLLEGAYGKQSGTGSTSAAAAPLATSGNTGNSASVNAYA